jgi:hypothetical protein
MKKILFFALLLMSASVFSQSALKFTSTKHSFGKLKQNVPATYAFSFVNTGNKPLVVEIATAECGCTTPDYPKEPIAKGREGLIKVTYNAATEGTFSKKVTVKFANIDDPTILTIEGEVVHKN